MATIPAEMSTARDRFLDLVAEVRPELHRYCSRLVGSAIDGEDVVQETLAKAFYALGVEAELPPLRPWLLRIAHNTAIDFLRRYERRFVAPMAEPPEPTPLAEAVAPDVVRASLSSFVALPVLSRSAVILKDVLGCSLEEIAETIGTTVPAVKSALSRGRASLRAQAKPDVTPWLDLPETTPAERALLDRYCSLFNARDWEGVRGLLSEECRLDLLTKAARHGRKQIVPYFGNYDKEDTRVARARAEGRDVLAVFRPASSPRPTYIIALESDGARVSLIRDYRYIPYLVDELALDLEPALESAPAPERTD
jgi:RNA polymerase sigma factor (sigma-70 family)